jgi:hypothetical protein
VTSVVKLGSACLAIIEAARTLVSLSFSLLFFGAQSATMGKLLTKLLHRPDSPA